MARTTFLALLPLISLIPYLVTAANPLGSSFQAAVLINNTIYVQGGEGVSGTISNLYSLDTSQPWSTINPPWTDLTSNAGTFTVPQTSFHAMWPAADGKSFYIWGGGNDYSITQTQSDFAQYNVIAGTWSLPSAITGMPVQKRDLSVVWSSSGVAYLWGGLGDMYTGYTTSNSTKYIFPEMTTFDTTKLIWNVFNVTNTTGQVPPPRVAHTATMLSNGQMVIIGGLIGTQVNETSIYLQYAAMTNIPVFDTYTTTWTLRNTTGNAPVTRRYSSAVLSSDGLSIIICCGGTQSSTVQLNDVAVLDSRTWAWTQPAISGTLPTPRLGHSAVLANGQMIVLFGEDNLGNALSDVAILDTRTSPFKWVNTFTPAGYVPSVTTNYTIPAHTTSTPTASSESSSALTAIGGIGGVIGIACAGLMLAFAAAFLIRRQQNKTKTATANAGSMPPDSSQGAGYRESVAYAAPVGSYPPASIPSTIPYQDLSQTAASPYPPMSNIPMGPPNPYPYGQSYTPMGYPTPNPHDNINKPHSPINTPQQHYALPPYQSGQGKNPLSTWTQ